MIASEFLKESPQTATFISAEINEVLHYYAKYSGKNIYGIYGHEWIFETRHNYLSYLYHITGVIRRWLDWAGIESWIFNPSMIGEGKDCNLKISLQDIAGIKCWKTHSFLEKSHQDYVGFDIPTDYYWLFHTLHWCRVDNSAFTVHHFYQWWCFGNKFKVHREKFLVSR